MPAEVKCSEDFHQKTAVTKRQGGFGRRTAEVGLARPSCKHAAVALIIGWRQLCFCRFNSEPGTRRQHAFAAPECRGRGCDPVGQYGAGATAAGCATGWPRAAGPASRFARSLD